MPIIIGLVGMSGLLIPEISDKIYCKCQYPVDVTPHAGLEGISGLVARVASSVGQGNEVPVEFVWFFEASG